MKELHICPKFEATLTLIGKRWTGLIIRVLLSGDKRFKEIKEFIPELSDRMLTKRLKELEAAGVLSRHVYPEMPVRIEYALTEKGRNLEPILNEIQNWAERWMDE